MNFSEKDFKDDIPPETVAGRPSADCGPKSANDAAQGFPDEAENVSDAAEDVFDEAKDVSDDTEDVFGDADGDETSSDTGDADGDKKRSFFSKKSKESKTEKKLLDQIDAQKKEIDEIRDRYLRVSADFDNFRKRTAKENETRYLDIKADVLKDFLPVIDNFERARVHEEDGASAKYSEGYGLIYTMLIDILEKNGVEEIDAQGQPFDPNLHNAVMHVDDESLGEGVVAEVFQKGYRMGDRVLRYSMVKVAN